jgi:hypothetical protein
MRIESIVLVDGCSMNEAGAIVVRGG